MCWTLNEFVEWILCVHIFKCNILHRKIFLAFLLKILANFYTFTCVCSLPSSDPSEAPSILWACNCHNITKIQKNQWSNLQTCVHILFDWPTTNNIDDETAEVEIWSPFVDVVDEFIKIVLDGAATIRVYKRFSAVRSLYTHYGWMGRPLPFFSQHSNAADVSFCYAMKWTFLPYHFVDTYSLFYHINII